MLHTWVTRQHFLINNNNNKVYPKQTKDICIFVREDEHQYYIQKEHYYYALMRHDRSLKFWQCHTYLFTNLSLVVVEYAYMKNSNELHGTSFEYMGELWCPYVGLRIGSEFLECKKMYYGFYEHWWEWDKKLCFWELWDLNPKSGLSKGCKYSNRSHTCHFDWEFYILVIFFKIFWKIIKMYCEFKKFTL